MNTKALEHCLQEKSIEYHRYNSPAKYNRYILLNTKVLEKEVLREISACGGKIAVNPKGFLVIIDSRTAWE